VEKLPKVLALVDVIGPRESFVSSRVEETRPEEQHVVGKVKGVG